MAQYANQKTITIKREKIDFKSNKQYLQAYTENIALASRTLGGEVPFKLYVYFLANQDGYRDDFSPQRFANIYGCSAQVAKRAFTKLEEAGYITHDINNRYEFHEVPQKVSHIKINEAAAEQRFVVQEDDTKKLMTYFEVYRELKELGWPEEEIKAFWENECKVVE